MRFIVFCLMFLIISLTPVLALEYNLVYDGNGNLLSGDGFNRSYNGFNQLSTVSYENGTLLYNYTFHPIEERVLVKKEYDLDGSLKEKTIYVNEMFVIVENSSGVYNFTYVKANGQLLAEKVNGETKFILNDHLGSNSIVTDDNGSIIENTTYTPFGSVITGGSAVRYGYEGKEHDGITSDVDFHFRQYKPSWGIFLQPDDVIQDVYDPQTLNRYAFERNNPYKYTDEDGHAFMIPVLVFIVAMWVARYIAENALPIIAKKIGRAIGEGKLFGEEHEDSTDEENSEDQEADPSQKAPAELPSIFSDGPGFPHNVNQNSGSGGNGPIYITTSDGNKKEWSGHSIGGVPYVTKDTPPGTEIGGGWKVKERKKDEADQES